MDSQVCLGVGRRCLWEGLRGRRWPIASDAELTATTSLRDWGNLETTPAVLIRAIAGMALCVAVVIATCVALSWLLWPVQVNPDEIEWMQRNSFAVAGCGIGFAIILACLESLPIAMSGAILVVVLAHGGPWLMSIPRLRSLLTYSGETKHAIFVVLGFATGIGLGFTGWRTRSPDAASTTQTLLRRMMEVVFWILFITAAAFAIYWISQQVSDKETHNAPLTAAAAACLLFFVLLVFPKIAPTARGKELFTQAFVPAATLGFVGAAAGWIINHPQLHDVQIVNGFGAGLIQGAMLTLAWVFLHWCVQPLCPKPCIAALLELVLLFAMAFALLFFAFKHLNRDSRWDALWGFGAGALVGIPLSCLLRCESRPSQPAPRGSAAPDPTQSTDASRGDANRAELGQR